jgi:hypothetical protein
LSFWTLRRRVVDTQVLLRHELFHDS